ncbi:uncharacterized protein LOC105828160 isoform X2 [Monomorium pharaonis]|uniref:uncharacterized protein LOC105828160 isoform X2 n=1 Tax=Monomorium pharaonis TaxID=307658 RepID=UPI00063F9DFA|nr:uncharacterized protein LOC105828160 isoform X2 [Monomorium pharaonis]
MAAPQASSRLEMLQARFQQKQLQEKEQKLLQLYDQQQQRAYQVVQRGSAGSNHGGSTAIRTATTVTATATTTTTTTSTSQGGKVRQMFDERRQTTVKGIDRSYPLEPLENKVRKQANINGLATQRNGNVTVNRQSVKRVARADVNSNINGGKPVVSYHEEISRESFGPAERRHVDDEDEYAVENRVTTFANGYYRHEADNEQEEALDQETIERNRMMAKIHLMGYDETLKHRVRNDLENEEFPEYLMVDVPDKLSKRNVTKKLSQAEERLERFKNTNAKRSNMPKQSTSIRKRSEQVPTKSNFRPRSGFAAGTSPISARSGSDRASERSQRVLENAISPDIKTFSQRTSPRSFSGINPGSNEFKSLTSDGKIIVRRSGSPQFFCRESERSVTTMSIDRGSDSSGSPLFRRETLTKQSRSSPFFLNESRRTGESNKPSVWSDTGILSKQSTSPLYDEKTLKSRSTSPQFFCRESERSATTMSLDRKSDSSGSPLFHRETLTKRSRNPPFFLSESRRAEQSKLPVWGDTRISSRQSTSPLYDEKTLKSRSTSPQFFCRESERSATTMSIDRATGESKSPSYDREIVKGAASPRFFLSDFERSRGTSEAKSPIWDRSVLPRHSTSPQYSRGEFKRSETATSTDRETIESKSSGWSKRDTSPQFFCKESERSATTMSIDRATSESKSPSSDWETVTRRNASSRFSESRRTKEGRSSVSKLFEWNKGMSTKRDKTDFERKKVQMSLDQQTPFSKSAQYEEKIFKKRNTSPQFFCKESERSATTMSIDRVTGESKSPSYDRKIITKRRASPRFFLSDSERSRTTSETKSPIWDREISSRQSTSPQYFGRESKRSETAMSTDRETIESKSSGWSKRNTSPQFFCRESERSATTMSIDRKVGEPKSSIWRDRKLLTERSATPRLLNGRTKRRSAAVPNIDQKYSEITSRNTSPQFFCKESEKSATTMLIESRSKPTNATENILKQRSDISYKQSRKSPIDKRISSTKHRRVPSHLTTNRHEVKKASEKHDISKSVTEGRRSSKISETSASSIVNLRYGLEFDNIFQSVGLVRKFMKSQNGKQRVARQSPSRHITKNVNARISARGDRSGNRRKTSPPVPTARSPSTGVGGRRATPEFPRKSITPTEVDVDIQEITMTDHRIERDKLQKASSPIPKRQFDGTHAKSSESGKAKFETSIACPVRQTRGRGGGSAFESRDLEWRTSRLSEGKSSDRRSDRESGESVVGPYKLSICPASESTRRVITQGGENESGMVSSQTRRDQAKYVAKLESRQRASSRSLDQIARRRSAESGTDSPRAATSPNFSRVGRRLDAVVSPILRDFAERTKGARTKFDQPQSLRSARLVQIAVKNRNSSASKNVGVDEVDAGTGVRYQTAVEAAAALSGGEETENYRKITRPSSADRVASEKVSSSRETTKPRKTTKSGGSKGTISPARECGRRHDGVRSRVSPRVSPLRKTAEITRGTATPKTSSSRSILTKADQSTASKLSTYTVKDRGVPVARRLAESFNKVMSATRGNEEPGDGAAREFFKVRDENSDLERMDSVESALRRFDAIGAEFERSSPITSFPRASPRISLRTMNAQAKAPVKEAISTSEAATDSSRGVTDHVTLRSTLRSPVGDGPKAKSAARRSDLRLLQKETRFSGGPTTKVGGFVESKRESTRTRSPTCKRRLFESESEKETRGDRPESSCAKARKNENCPLVSDFRFRQDKAVSSARAFEERIDVTRESTEETSAFSVKPLRSIEDIRKSIDDKRNKLTVAKELRSAIANRRLISREGVDARRPRHLATDVARSTKIKSCVSRMTKSPSPDSAAIKQRETNVRTTRGSTPSSPSKSPDVAPRRTTAESRNQETKSSKRTTIARGADSIGNKTIDTVDGVVFQNGSPNESTRRKSDALMNDFDDRPSKEDDAMPSKKSSVKKFSNDKQQTASSASTRPTSSNSSVNLIQDSSAKDRMAESEKGKPLGKVGSKNRGKGIEKPSSSNGKLANAPSFNEDATNDMKGLVKCKMCGRSFAQNRIDLHENICLKTTTKKRKQFDPVMSRVKGTELEPFVKRGLAKRETKMKKSESKPDWRRKHEEFINTIRYARETQARLAAGETLDDLPPPPPSDTSDYIQCEHCGRKFNRSAAERHIPICKRMHDKKQTQAPRAPRR